jgi:hypothetical protein
MKDNEDQPARRCSLLRKRGYAGGVNGSVEIRDGRYAANEAAYRRVNERIRSYKERDDHVDAMAFRCECAEGACIDAIHVRLDEYRRVRRHPMRFIIAPGHDAPELERVVERHSRYWVVEKNAGTEDA